MTTSLPASSEVGLEDSARAHLDAKEAKPFGKAMGEPVPDERGFPALGL